MSDYPKTVEDTVEWLKEILRLAIDTAGVEIDFDEPIVESQGAGFYLTWTEPDFTTVESFTEVVPLGKQDREEGLIDLRLPTEFTDQPPKTDAEAQAAVIALFRIARQTVAVGEELRLYHAASTVEHPNEHGLKVRFPDNSTYAVVTRLCAKDD